jgi:hypothetical protein
LKGGEKSGFVFFYLLAGKFMRLKSTVLFSQTNKPMSSNWAIRKLIGPCNMIAAKLESVFWIKSLRGLPVEDAWLAVDERIG